jgi:cell division protein YceG involved in septum cleavage
VYNKQTTYMPSTFIKPLKIVFGVLIFCFVLVASSALGFFVWTKHFLSSSTAELSSQDNILEQERFPVGVNSDSHKITEDPLVDWYMQTHLSIDTKNLRQENLFNRLLAQVAKWDWYQNLASSVSRILVIYPGERKEEIVENIGDILNWDNSQRELFSDYIVEAEPYIEEGKFFPGRYVVASDATPEIVADLLYEKFSTEILARYDEEVEKSVPLAEALVIASLLEREAYDFTDMRYISGIIWNRLFIDMPLQLDASLQYAKGSKQNEPLWWPKVVPSDKFIISSYNTYENTGLPPAAISNPSVEAIVAALNPRVTECMFYFHDAKGKFYCTKTYEEHIAKLKEVYGRGK